MVTLSSGSYQSQDDVQATLSKELHEKGIGEVSSHQLWSNWDPHFYNPQGWNPIASSEAILEADPMLSLKTVAQVNIMIFSLAKGVESEETLSTFRVHRNDEVINAALPSHQVLG